MIVWYSTFNDDDFWGFIAEKSWMGITWDRNRRVPVRLHLDGVGTCVTIFRFKGSDRIINGLQLLGL